MNFFNGACNLINIYYRRQFSINYYQYYVSLFHKLILIVARRKDLISYVDYGEWMRQWNLWRIRERLRFDISSTWHRQFHCKVNLYQFFDRPVDWINEWIEHRTASSLFRQCNYQWMNLTDFHAMNLLRQSEIYKINWKKIEVNNLIFYLHTPVSCMNAFMNTNEVNWNEPAIDILVIDATDPRHKPVIPNFE